MLVDESGILKVSVGVSNPVDSREVRDAEIVSSIADFTYEDESFETVVWVGVCGALGEPTSLWTVLCFCPADPELRKLDTSYIEDAMEVVSSESLVEGCP